MSTASNIILVKYLLLIYNIVAYVGVEIHKACFADSGCIGCNARYLKNTKKTKQRETILDLFLSLPITFKQTLRVQCSVFSKDKSFAKKCTLLIDTIVCNAIKELE